MKMSADNNNLGRDPIDKIRDASKYGPPAKKISVVSWSVNIPISLTYKALNWLRRMIVK